MTHRTLPCAPRPLAAALALLLPATSLIGAEPPVTSAGPTVQVTTCADAGTGSLRAAFTTAVDGETIDLSQLQCSAITLTTGELLSPSAANTITVSASQLAPVTIDAAGNSRIFHHRGTGVLFANNLVIKNGAASSSSGTGGGCVYTLGSFFTQFVTISNCSFQASSHTPARGGAVSALGTVSLFFSNVSGNSVKGSSALSGAGGIFAQSNTTLIYSTVDNNHNICSYGQLCKGGGIYSSTINSSNSTISNNTAESGAGIFVMNGGAITQSTISTNVATGAAGGVFTSGALNITSSTVTGNRAGFQIGAGVYLFTSQASNITGTIVNGNTSQDGLYPSDVGGTSMSTITGSDNLIGASTRPVPIRTSAADPKLGPLQDNGGVTKTHLVGDCSPAIGRGSQGNFTFTWDQRGPPHNRVSGTAIDIGSTEYFTDVIFKDGFEDVSAEKRIDQICTI